MSAAAPQVLDSLLTPFPFAPVPLRFIGKHPVFQDEHGEFVLLFLKVAHLRNQTIDEVQFKVDANIDAMRNAFALTLRLTEEIDRSKPKTEGTLGYIVHKNLNQLTVSGETSLPRALFGKDYHYARHTRDDDRDLRKAAFQPKEKKVSKK